MYVQDQGKLSKYGQDDDLFQLAFAPKGKIAELESKDSIYVTSIIITFQQVESG
jgi:hypothetical protein